MLNDTFWTITGLYAAVEYRLRNEDQLKPVRFEDQNFGKLNSSFFF